MAHHISQITFLSPPHITSPALGRNHNTWQPVCKSTLQTCLPPNKHQLEVAVKIVYSHFYHSISIYSSNLTPLCTCTPLKHPKRVYLFRLLILPLPLHGPNVDPAHLGPLNGRFRFPDDRHVDHLPVERPGAAACGRGRGLAYLVLWCWEIQGRGSRDWNEWE